MLKLTVWTDSSKPPATGSSDKVQKESFCVVVGVVGGKQKVKTMLCRNVTKPVVTEFTGRHLNRELMS